MTQQRGHLVGIYYFRQSYELTTIFNETMILFNHIDEIFVRRFIMSRI